MRKKDAGTPALAVPLHTRRTVCIECGDFILTDITGSYNASGNPEGYGTPNPAFGVTTPYTAAFYRPKEAAPVFTLDLNADPPMDDEDGYYRYVVPKASLGILEGEPPSGIWRIAITFGTAKEDLMVFADADIKAKIGKCICCASPKNSMLMLDLISAKELCKCFKYDDSQRLVDQLYRDTKTCCDCGCS